MKNKTKQQFNEVLWDWVFLHSTTESLEPELYSKCKWSSNQAIKQSSNRNQLHVWSNASNHTKKISGDQIS